MLKSQLIWILAALLSHLIQDGHQFVILVTTGWLTRMGKRASQAEIGRQAALDPNATSQTLRGLQANIRYSRLLELRAFRKQCQQWKMQMLLFCIY